MKQKENGKPGKNNFWANQVSSRIVPITNIQGKMLFNYAYFIEIENLLEFAIGRVDIGLENQNLLPGTFRAGNENHVP